MKELKLTISLESACHHLVKLVQLLLGDGAKLLPHQANGIGGGLAHSCHNMLKVGERVLSAKDVKEEEAQF